MGPNSPGPHLRATETDLTYHTAYEVRRGGISISLPNLSTSSALVESGWLRCWRTLSLLIVLETAAYAQSKDTDKNTLPAAQKDLLAWILV